MILFPCEPMKKKLFIPLKVIKIFILLLVKI